MRRNHEPGALACLIGMFLHIPSAESAVRGLGWMANDVGRYLHLKIGLGEACVGFSAVDFDPDQVTVLEDFNLAG